MAEKRNKRPARCKEEIVPLHEHRRITLRCPSCEEFSLMDIRKKTSVKGMVNYHVTWPQCGYEFKQVGRPYNIWRDIKQRYRLGHAQLRSMQAKMLRNFLKAGRIDVEETEDIIRMGDAVFIKPKHRNKTE